MYQESEYFFLNIKYEKFFGDFERIPRIKNNSRHRKKQKLYKMKKSEPEKKLRIRIPRKRSQFAL